jgi:hypothetical protein
MNKRIKRDVSNHAQAREWTTEGNGKQQAGKIVRAML